MGTLLIVVRGVSDAALLSAFGTALGWAWLAPGAGGQGRLRQVLLLSVLAALAATAAWVLLLGLVLGGSVADAGLVLRSTQFGHVMAARFVMLALAGASVMAGLRWAGAALAGAALVTQAAVGHAWAMSDGAGWLVVCVAVHVLAAGAWIGGLLPLALLLGKAGSATGAALSARFSRLGAVCVGLLAVTAWAQGMALTGSWAGLATAYGLVLVAKLSGFLVLLGFAWWNRYRLTPALAGPAGAVTRAALVRSVLREAALGATVVLLAGLLASLPPGAG